MLINDDNDVICKKIYGNKPLLKGFWTVKQFFTLNH